MQKLYTKLGLVSGFFLLILGGFGCVTTESGTLYGLRLQPLATSVPPVVSTPVAQPAKKDSITIQFFGDIMLDRNVAKVMGKDGLDYIFAKVAGTDFFTGNDLLFANLEGPFAPKRIATSKEIAFRFDPALANDLKEYGFTGFTLANNHAYDMGRSNAAYTRQVLAQNDFGFFGDELQESEALSTWATSTGGTSFTFIGLHNTYHKIDQKKVKVILQNAKAKTEVVIINIHWGEEYHPLSNKAQQTLAHWLVDNGADAIIGHHPHVVEEAEIYKGKPIFYSLGNFIFDQYFSTSTQEGLSVRLTVENKKITTLQVVPFFGVKSQVEPMTGERKEKFMEWFGANSRFGDKQFKEGEITL